MNPTAKTNDPFRVVSDFQPAGDQPGAIAELIDSVGAGNRFTTLVGVTGSGKTYTVAKLIEAVQKPVIVIAHNKILAAQLCNEFKGFFPENAVEYFISYYDYYQPEAYIPYSDTYIEKDASINEEIDRLRHSATQSALLRRDVVVVASVSCIYGLGSPADYMAVCLHLEQGMELDRDELLRNLIAIQYERTDGPMGKSTFRVRGGTVEIMAADKNVLIKLDFFGDTLERITFLNPENGKKLGYQDRAMLFPATHYVMAPGRLNDVMGGIETELDERVAELKMELKDFEAKRLAERTMFDLEMMREMGYCHGIENYSRHFDGREPGERPNTLLDYFLEDYLVIIDESHVTLPQLRAMYNGDRSRKKNLVEHGFRLPCAYDNRPLTFDEFMEIAPQVVFVSATPGPYELEISQRKVEQIIRPTGLVDPVVEILPSAGQMERLLQEIERTTERGERTLVTTLTKKMAEDLTEYLLEQGIRARYMHSDIEALERIQIIFQLRNGDFDALVGINLLREGLDLPEVSLVAILDADKEGFLRSDVTLIQTMGRAARNVNGRAILFADVETGSMQRAITETRRRRRLQLQYNEKHGLTPRTIVKNLSDRMDTGGAGRASEAKAAYSAGGDEAIDAARIPIVVAELEAEMWKAADSLDFESAAVLRDRIMKLKKREKKGGQAPAA